MGREITCLKIVFVIIEWCDDRMGEKVGPSDRVFVVKLGIYVNREECCKEGREDRSNKCQRPVDVSRVFSQIWSGLTF